MAIRCSTRRRTWTCAPSFSRCPTGCASHSCSITTRGSRSGTWPPCSAGPRGRSRRICTRPAPGSARRWGNPVPEPRDELDTWLSEQVKPLLPRPGTFERVSRQARRRRTRQALVAAAGAVAVAAVAAVVIPTVAIPALETGRQTSAAGASHGPAASPGRTAPQPSSPGPAVTSTGRVAGAPPPLSVTFVGVDTGWVMGQKLPARRCDRPAAPACISLRRTDTSGSAWRTVHPPPAHGPNGATGVSQTRFLTRSNGWAFGPQLWATHNAGRTWTLIPTGGRRVTALEARGQRVFSVWARCTGTGPSFAAHCSDFAVYSSRPGSDNWAPVPGASAGSGTGGTGQAGAGEAGTGAAASLMLTGTTAYLLSPQGFLVSGPLTGAAWQPVTGTAGPAPTPCRPGPAQPDGQPLGALLASVPAGLALLCTGPSAGGRPAMTIYTSADGGRTWQPTGQAPAAGIATALSGSPSGGLVLATSMGIEVSPDGGATWSPGGGSTLTGGFAYVGMTTSTQGVAVPAGSASRAVWFTYDGGSTWQSSPGSA